MMPRYPLDLHILPVVGLFGAKGVLLQGIEQLRHIVVGIGYRLLQLAAAIGYHQVQIARYETGHNTPPIAYLVKFCQHDHVSADYLLGLPRGLDWPRDV